MYITVFTVPQKITAHKWVCKQKKLRANHLVPWGARDSKNCSFKNKADSNSSKKPIAVWYTKIGKYWFAQVVNENKNKCGHCLVALMIVGPSLVQKEIDQKFFFDTVFIVFGDDNRYSSRILLVNCYQNLILHESIWIICEKVAWYRGHNTALNNGTRPPAGFC